MKKTATARPDDAGGDVPEPKTPAAPPKPSADPFDLANLRLGQNYQALVGVQKHVTTVPVRKPTKEEFVRVRPEPECAIDTVVLELKDDREIYLVDRSLWDGLASERTVGPRRLHLAVNRQGVLFLWPLKLPSPDGRQDRWGESALEAAETAKTQWVRVQADMALGAYVFFTPVGEVSGPEWPAVTLQEALKLGFRSTLIDSHDHLVLRRLRGEV